VVLFNSFWQRRSERINLIPNKGMPNFRGYGQSLRFHAREKGKNSRENNGDSCINWERVSRSTLALNALFSGHTPALLPSGSSLRPT
jgi:hypothetical protein